MKKNHPFIIAAAFFLCACGGTKTDKTAEAGEANKPAGENTVEISHAQYEAIGIKLGSAEMKPVSGLLKVNGYIDVPPQNLQSVTTQMGGDHCLYAFAAGE